jgi:hypothetical protein
MEATQGVIQDQLLESFREAHFSTQGLSAELFKTQLHTLQCLAHWERPVHFLG